MKQTNASTGARTGAMVAVAGLAALVGAAAAFSAAQFLESDAAAPVAVIAEQSVPVILSPDRPMPTGPVQVAVAAPRPAPVPLDDDDPRWVAVDLPALLRPEPSAREALATMALAKPDAGAGNKPAPRVAGRAPSTEGTSARVNDDVRLRAGPDNGAAVIGVVTRSSPIVVHSCRGWCDVSAGSKRGYVFRKFIDYGKSESPSGPVTSSVTLTQPAKARPSYEAPTP